MEKFLVTGGAGFIGSNICKKLVSDGCFVRIVDNLLTGKKSNLIDFIDKIEFIEADMGDEEVARTAMKDIDVVVHQGALASVPRSVDDPAATHKHCVDATFTLLLAARDAGIKRFVYASSSSAYGDTPTLPKVETMLPQPLSPYAVGKLVGEYYCSVFYAAAIPAFVTAILKDTPPTVFGDGLQSRDFTYIDNVVEANLLAARAEHTAGDVVNIAGGQAVTVNETIEIINTTLGKNIKPIYTDPRPGDVKHSLADIKAAEKLIGFKTKVPFKQGLQLAIDWYRENLL
jgi:UDP-glucose 4-epimerase